MMACDVDAATTRLHGPSDDVHLRPIMPNHVEIDRGKIVHSAAEISGQGQRLEENFRKDHSGTDVEHDASITQRL